MWNPNICLKLEDAIWLYRLLKTGSFNLLWLQLSNLRPFTFQIHEHSLDCNEQLNRCIRWADALVIVFSITDYKSFELLSHLYHHVRQLHPGNMVPVVIVANKADLLHIKEVEPQQGLQLANMLGCTFYEVSVSENYNNVFNAFHLLCKEVNKQQITSTPERRRTSLIPRPKSPNMQDLKRRFKQALSAKVRTVTSVWQHNPWSFRTFRLRFWNLGCLKLAHAESKALWKEDGLSSLLHGRSL